MMDGFSGIKVKGGLFISAGPCDVRGGASARGQKDISIPYREVVPPFFSPVSYPSAIRRFLFGILALFTIHSPLATVVSAADPGIEFGAADDLSVMGVEGNAADPDVEVKGFTVFGSTQASYPGAVTGPGNVVVNGYLSVSSGSYFTGSSTFSAASAIYIADGNDNEVLAKNGAGGPLKWTAVSALGDNLGNHNATQRLNMEANPIVGVSSLSVIAPDTFVSSLWVSTSAKMPHLYVSTNGSVGIGTAGPQAALDVVSTGATVNDYAQIWRNSAGTIVSSMTATGVLYPQAAGGFSGTEIAVSTVNAAASTPYGGVNITTNTYVGGKLGVGLTNPSAGLHVQSYAAGIDTLYVSTSATAGQYIISVSSTGVTNINNMVIENRTSDPVTPVVGQVWFRVD